MYKALFALLSLYCWNFSFAQNEKEVNRVASLVDYDSFKALVLEVEAHRAERLISLEQMHQMSLEVNTVILDTRSKEMYDAKHVKGAIHLNFSDFTQANLMEIIPDVNTRIIIYCNNNFEDDPIYFATKSRVLSPEELKISSLHIPDGTETAKDLGITMALNIPTYINLYGYGYKNVYELKDLISVFDPFIVFEGTAVSGN